MSETEVEAPVETTEAVVEEETTEAVVETKNQPETKKEGQKNGELLIFTVVIIIQLST